MTTDDKKSMLRYERFAETLQEFRRSPGNTWKVNEKLDALLAEIIEMRDYYRNLPVCADRVG